MKVQLDCGAIMPTRAHDTDIGFDLYATEPMEIPPGGCAVFDTGVHMEIPRGWAGLLVSKSGLYIVHDITSTGLIDPGYTGSVRVKLTNLGADTYKVERGDKISQIVFIEACTPSLTLVDRLDPTERGDNGFGSTGR